MEQLTNSSVLITGGTGSFGRAFVRFVLKHHRVRRLIVLSRDELKQHEMMQAFPSSQYPEMRFFLGDVRDLSRLEIAFRGVDFVIHAAALKQIPAAEYNPLECIKTNVGGAENVVRAALQAGVKKVLALSTDKAANPINLYGASKLASDKIFIAANFISARQTIYSVVRYGNVLGSRGSVVPYFQNLLREGATELPITDPRMTRFWITMGQGVRFVLSCLETMRGGEVFVPKIPSMSMPALAEALAPGLPTRVVGIRPGEKLHEIMITEDDSRNTVELDDRFVIVPDPGFGPAADCVPSNGRPVPDRFTYASHTNPDVLDAQRLHRMLAETD